MTAENKLKPLPRQGFCNFCGEQKPNLPHCQRCEMVRYCCRAHQIADHPKHKANCLAIDQCRKDVSLEAERLRNMSWNADPYGKFWAIESTREYMYAQLRLSKAMGPIDTPDAVSAQLSLQLSMSKLGRRDNGLYMKTSIPGLMLRLGKDQECYDFLKWWGTTPINSPCFDNIYLPYLDLQGSNVYEHHDWIYSKGSLEFSMIVALTLIKIRLQLDLKLLQGAFPPNLATTGSSRHAMNSNQSAAEKSDNSLKETAARNNVQETPAIHQAAQDEPAHIQPSDKSTSLQASSGETDAQKPTGKSLSDTSATTVQHIKETSQKQSLQTNMPAASTQSADRDENSEKKDSPSSLGPTNADRIIPYLRSNVVVNRLEALKFVDHSNAIGLLDIEISELYILIDKLNARFWGDLLNPMTALGGTFCFVDLDGMTESFGAVRVSHRPWYETPGAIEMIRVKRNKLSKA